MSEREGTFVDELEGGATRQIYATRVGRYVLKVVGEARRRRDARGCVGDCDRVEPMVGCNAPYPGDAPYVWTTAVVVARRERRYSPP